MTRKEVEALMQEHPPLQSMHNACINAVCRSWLDLEAENARLKRGEFTEDEFQNLVASGGYLRIVAECRRISGTGVEAPAP